MSDRAYVLINVHPGRTVDVVKALGAIKEIKQIDPCWGKPDIFTIVEIPHQDALTQLVIDKIHAIPGVEHTDSHMVYRLQEGKPK